MDYQRLRGLSLPACLFLASAVSTFAQTNVITQHNDIGRTGQNVTETVLNTTNVNSATFGKLFTLTVDGAVYAQPLYLSNVVIGGASHRVVFVATEHDSVYAFDAASGAQLWHATMLDAAHGAAAGAIPEPESDTGCTDITRTGAPSEYGITGTPVIDPVAGILYVVAETYEGSYPVLRLHALDITTGLEKLGTPATLAATVSGSGSGGSGGVIAFDPKWENQRAGLLLLNGNVYIGFGSHCDYSPWHGWLLGYNASTLAQTGVFMTTPDGSASGIWMSGTGLAADIESNVPRIFPATGNGSFDATVPYTTNNVSYGDDILRLNVANGITVADMYTPSNQAALSNADEDVGSGGVLILPDQPGAYPHLLAQIGKSGVLYIVNRENMGGYSSSADNIVQTIDATGGGDSFTGVWGSMAYWNNNLYIWPRQTTLERFPISNGLVASTAADIAPAISYPSPGFISGGVPSVSANGSVAGSGIVWAVDTSETPQILYAYNAGNVSQLLWDSAQNATRDGFSTNLKYVVPTIADGQVFVGTIGQVAVYGLLATPAVPDFTLSAAPTTLAVQPGSATTSQLSVAAINGFSGTLSLSATGLPSGVTASFVANSASNITLTLTAAANAAPTSSPAAITVTGVSGSLSHSVALSLSVSNATVVNMAASFNIYGIFNDGSTVTNGGLDTASYAYSATLLGTKLSALGLPFYFGTPGQADAANNVTVPLPAGTFAALNFLGTAIYGNQASQPFVVTYTDGTTSSFTQGLSDWISPQGYPGETVALTMPYRLTANGGTQNGPWYLYAYSFPLNNTKTVKSMTLPAIRNITVLAMTLSGPAAKTQSAQTITFNPIAAQTVGTPLTLTASASSGLSVTYTASPASVCTVAGTTASFSAAGTCAITASQAGNSSYTAATSITHSFTVSPKGTFTIAAATAKLTVTPPVCYFFGCFGGASATDKITVATVGNFTGTVTFAVTGLPTGVTASFSPASLAAPGSSTLTLTPASNTARSGTATLTIHATSGATAATTNITLSY